ncbi:MAG: hypothetical protein WBG00_02840 [Thermoanaerobaculia bacterium]
MSKRGMLLVGVLLCACALVGPMTQADDAKGRGAVKDFSFVFQPSPGQLDGVRELKVCVVPMINSNDLSHHTKNLEKALRNMEPEEFERILGIRFAANGKPLNRFLTPETFDTIIEAALKKELQALGMEVVPAPTTEPPEDMRSKTLMGLADLIPAEDEADLLLAAEIEDFYFQTTVGTWKLKMETFFVLDVRVVDVAAREVLWEGEVEAGELQKKGTYMGKEAVDNRLNDTFKDFIEGVLRNNTELQEALGDLE